MTIIRQEKSIHSACKEVMKHNSLFLDALHVKKNMSANLGLNKGVGINFHGRGVRAPSKVHVSALQTAFCTFREKGMS